MNATGGIVREVSIEDLAELFNEPRKGNKHIGYFVRGELNPPERKDAYLASADMLVLDGDATNTDDSSCCPPIDVNMALTEMNINHVIYTTHSHSFNKNKFRVIIPCTITSKDNLKSTVLAILKELKNKDVDIKNVKEMSTWTQPWFIPSRDDPTDGMFEFYSYTTGDDYVESESSFGINASDIVSNSPSDDGNRAVVSSPSESISDIIRCITNGEEGLHHAVNKYAYMQVKDGIAPNTIVATLQGLMSACPSQDERWQERYADIPRCVDGAVNKMVEESTVDVTDLNTKGSEAIAEIPWPPGLLGQLAEDAYQTQVYQYREVAVVSAVGLVAGIAGRKFNVSNTGLNVYLTLIMDTGMGKDSIVKFISRALFDIVDEGDGLATSSFLGKSKFTGAKAIVNRMKSALSQISVFTEAGLLMQTKSGDQSGILRTLLDIYTKSGNNDIFIGAEYSDEDKSVPNLRAPALSIINESTADSLQQAFKDNNSIDSGHLPRQSIYRVVGDKPYRNWNAGESHISDICMEKLKELSVKCSKVQAISDPKAWDFYFAEGIGKRASELEQFYTDEYNTFRGTNNTKANMASRMPLKALKFAAIASVFNHHELVIHKTEWEWAEALVKYEYDGVDSFFVSAGSGEMGDIVTHVVGPCIIKMLKGGYKSYKSSISTIDRHAGIIPLSVLSFNLKSNTALKKLDDDATFRTNPKTGLQKILDHMIQYEYIKIIKDPHGRRKQVYKVTDQFRTLMS